MSAKLKELREKQAAKQKALHDVLEEAGDTLDMEKVKSIAGDADAKVAWIQDANDELNDITDEVSVEAGLVKASADDADREKMLKTPVDRPDTPQGEPEKSIGERVMESIAVTEKSGPTGPAVTFKDVDPANVGRKADFATSAGWLPESTRGPRVVLDAQRPVEVLDLIPTTTTDQVAVKFMEETTFTNSAAGAVEGAAYGEAVLALTPRSSPVEKVAVFLPVTDEQLEDVAQATGYINNRLPFMLRQKLDTDVVTGSGTAPVLAGFLNVTGIQTIAKGTIPVPDAVHKAITLVNVTGRASADGILMHANDWQEIRLLRTTDGVYIFGSPSEVIMPRLWGLPVAVNSVITENTALVGDFGMYTELSYKRGIDVQISNSHASYFTTGKQAIRADLRVALVVYRPAALCTVTAI